MSGKSTQEIQIKRVETKADWNQFIDLPWSLYKNDPFWVPPLKVAVRDTLDTNKNPFFKHAYMAPLLALKGDQVVGRIVGVIDDANNKFHEEMTAFFGFFESVDDQKVADALLNAVKDWAKNRGMNSLRGPMSPSTNHECGLLVEGFNDSPSVMMPYNPGYYPTMLDKYGFQKSKDLFAYTISGDAKFSDRLLAQAERLKQNGSVTFRTIRMSEFEKEIEIILDIYNDAWEKNWGFVPMTKEEFRHMAKDMKPILDPELLLIAEVRGEPAAFALALPDVNQALKKNPKGSLFPLGLLKLLWNMKGPGKKTTLNRCRVLTLGIKKAYREAGIGPILYLEYLKRGPANGYPSGEASWILEDNVAMNRALEHMCGKRTKVYRIYDQSIS
jgi:hypothetical protein